MAFLEPRTDNDDVGFLGFAGDTGYHLGKTIRLPYDLLFSD